MIGHRETHRIRCVPECFNHLQIRRAEPEPVPLVQILVRVSGLDTGMHINVRAGASRQLVAAGDVIGMQVGVEDMGDSNAVLLRRLKITPDMPLGIDNAGRSRRRTADQI